MVPVPELRKVTDAEQPAVIVMVAGEVMATLRGVPVPLAPE
jgi:hypothetical protein